MFLLIFILILYFVFLRRAMKKRKRASAKATRSPAVSNKRQGSAGALKRTFAEHTTGAVGVIRDEKNDWLSRQIEEERRAQVRVSAMLGLKRSHEANCDAKALKQEHLNEHGKY